MHLEKIAALSDFPAQSSSTVFDATGDKDKEIEGPSNKGNLTNSEPEPRPRRRKGAIRHSLPDRSSLLRLSARQHRQSHTDDKSTRSGGRPSPLLTSEARQRVLDS